MWALFSVFSIFCTMSFGDRNIPNTKKLPISFRRYQDVHNQSFIMVLASGRWLGVRLDLLSSLLIGAVALAAVLAAQDAGRYICNPGGGDSYMKGAGMLVVSLRGANHSCRSHLGCSGRNAENFSRHGNFWGCARRNNVF